MLLAFSSSPLRCQLGESGLGKSTLVNSLFLTDLYKDRKLLNAEGKLGAKQGEWDCPRDQHFGSLLQQQLQAWLDPSPLVCGSALLCVC